MKKNSKGFMLIDTLIVSITVSAILIYLYFQFANVNDSYNKSFKYNNVERLYAGADIKENILYNGKDSIYSTINSNSFVDLSDCPATYYNNTDYCNMLYSSLDIKKVLITKSNLNDLKTLMSQAANVNNYDETLRDLIKKSPDSSDGYQLFMEFNNGEAAVVWMKEA